MCEAVEKELKRRWRHENLREIEIILMGNCGDFEKK